MTALSLAIHARPRPDDDDHDYSAFYRRYERPLVCYLRMGFRDADVEAVAQETFCRALTHWSEVGRMSNPWPWLAVTGRNLARNNIRDEKASQATGLDVFDVDECSAVDVAEQVEASDQLRRLAQAMDVLTPLQRRLLTVMVEEGLTGAQVARRLGMQPGAARMHLSRMRGRLEERFVKLGGVLGLAPVALTGVLRRLTRPRRYGVQQLALTAGSTALTVSAAVMAISLGTGGSVGRADTHAAVPPVQQLVAAADVHAARVAATTTQRHAQHLARAASASSAVPAVTYRADVSRTPTAPGKTADIWMSLTSPVGPVNVGVPVEQGSPANPVGDPCPAGRRC
jgi:RNA polymerase sigma-70 factor (ECF subfamily)